MVITPTCYRTPIQQIHHKNETFLHIPRSNDDPGHPRKRKLAEWEDPHLQNNKAI